MKLKPRNPVARAKQSGAGRHVDKREIWSKGHESFNNILDEFHIEQVEDKEVVRASLNKLKLHRRVE
jgi:hypothetical protein